MERLCGAAVAINAKQQHCAGQMPFYHGRFLHETLTPGTIAPLRRPGMLNGSISKCICLICTKGTSSCWWLVWRWAALELSAEQRWMPTPASFTVKTRAAIKKSKVGSQGDAMVVTQPAGSVSAAPLGYIGWVYFQAGSKENHLKFISTMLAYGTHVRAVSWQFLIKQRCSKPKLLSWVLFNPYLNAKWVQEQHVPPVTLHHPHWGGGGGGARWATFIVGTSLLFSGN